MYHRDSNFADRLRFRFSGRANTPGACRRRGQLGSAIHTHIRPVSTRRQKPHFRQNTTSQGYCSINCGDDPFRSRRERAELVAISVQSNAAFESLRRPRRRRCGGADPKPTRRQRQTSLAPSQADVPPSFDRSRERHSCLTAPCLLSVGQRGAWCSTRENKTGPDGCETSDLLSFRRHLVLPKITHMLSSLVRRHLDRRLG
jgi:hypothetical protein